MTEETKEQLLKNYDPNSFTVPASDSDGHNTRLWFRCPPGLAQQIGVLIQTKKFPYRTSGSLLRHALLLHLQWLETLAEVPSVLAQVELISDTMRTDEFMKQFKSIFTTLQKQVSDFIADGSPGEAVRTVLKAKANIQSMPDGYWRDKYLLRLEKDYEFVLADAPTADLGNIGEEEE